MRLKKVLAAVLATALVVTSFVAVPGKQAKAAESVKTMFADTPEGDGYTVEYLGHWIDPATNTARLIDNRAFMGGTTDSLDAYKAGHKPIGNAGDSKNQPGKAFSQIIFNFTVETAGEYTVNFYYASQFKSATQPRSFAYMVNAENDEYAEGVQYHQYEFLNSAKKDDADVVALVDDLKAKGIVGDGGVCDYDSAKSNAGWFKIVKQEATITLKAGENKIAICSPSDFDDDSIKAINFYGLDYVLSKAETPAEIKTGETVVLSENSLVTLEGLNDNVQSKTMTLNGETISNTCIGLKPVSVEKKAEAKVTYTVNADKAGTYDIEVVYAAKGDNRPMSVKVNNDAAKDVELADTGAHEVCAVKKISVHLNKGANVITFGPASTYDNDAVKTPNLVSAKAVLTQEDKPSTPNTGVVSMVLPVAAIMLISGVMAARVIKKED